MQVESFPSNQTAKSARHFNIQHTSGQLTARSRNLKSPNHKTHQSFTAKASHIPNTTHQNQPHSVSEINRFGLIETEQ